MWLIIKQVVDTVRCQLPVDGTIRPLDWVKHLLGLPASRTVVLVGVGRVEHHMVSHLTFEVQIRFPVCVVSSEVKNNSSSFIFHYCTTHYMFTIMAYRVIAQF